ncbi:unnamed protein product [Rhizopus microsporus]
MSSRKPELVPLNLKIDSNKELSISAAASFLDNFLHNGVAIHAANNTVSAQLHQLHQGLKKKRKSIAIIQQRKTKSFKPQQNVAIYFLYIIIIIIHMHIIQELS